MSLLWFSSDVWIEKSHETHERHFIEIFSFLLVIMSHTTPVFPYIFYISITHIPPAFLGIFNFEWENNFINYQDSHQYGDEFIIFDSIHSKNILQTKLLDIFNWWMDSLLNKMPSIAIDLFNSSVSNTNILVLTCCNCL